MNEHDFLTDTEEQVPFTVRDDIRSYGKLASADFTGMLAGQVELTSSCFQRCRMCDSWRDDRPGLQRGILSLAKVCELCRELEQRCPHFTNLALTGGDPQKWPHLNRFLYWFCEQSMPFNLQVNTALTRPVLGPERDLWERAFLNVRVSLDSIFTDTYQKIRGDKRTRPEDVIANIRSLGHPRVQINCCITPDNVGEMRDMLRYLATELPDLRKLTFLPVIGDREERTADFWHDYERVSFDVDCGNFGFDKLPFETSFADSVIATRQFLLSPEAASVPCWAGVRTFHIKATGDWYPCCLVGGEALATYSDMSLGNINDESISGLLQRIATSEPEHHYCEGKPCRDICQYKQTAFNVAAHEAGLVQLAMP